MLVDSSVPFGKGPARFQVQLLVSAVPSRVHGAPFVEAVGMGIMREIAVRSEALLARARPERSRLEIVANYRRQAERFEIISAGRINVSLMSLSFSDT